MLTKQYSAVEIMLCYTNFIVFFESACIYHVLVFPSSENQEILNHLLVSRLLDFALRCLEGMENVSDFPLRNSPCFAFSNHYSFITYTKEGKYVKRKDKSPRANKLCFHFAVRRFKTNGIVPCA